MSGGKKKRSKAYLDDFKKTASGEYAWQGAEYAWDGGKAGQRRALFKLWTAGSAMAAATLAAGCIPAAGMDGCFYLLLPYLLQAVLVIRVLWLLGRLSGAGSRIRAYIYEETVHKFPFSIRAYMICTGVVLVCEAFFLLRNGFQGKIFSTALFAVAELVSLTGGQALSRILGGLVWDRIEKSRQDC